MIVRDEALRQLQRLLYTRHRSVQLLVVNRLEKLTHARSRLDAEGQQVPAEEQRPGRTMFDAERPRPFEKPVHR